MTKVIAITHNVVNRNREKVFALLVASIFLALAAYVILVHQAVLNVVEREKILSEINAKSSEVAGLEAKYFTIRNSITLELAHTKGFRDVAVSNYISKKSVTAMASPHEL